MSALSLLAQTTVYTVESTNSGGGMGLGLSLFYLALAIVGIVALWKTFLKAGKPGWGALIPIYNVYLLVKVAGRPGWWLLLYLVPIVNLIVHIIISLDIAKAFGKSSAFGIIGLWLFSFIGFLILGFGDAKYTAPKNA